MEWRIGNSCTVKCVLFGCCVDVGGRSGLDSTRLTRLLDRFDSILFYSNESNDSNQSYKRRGTSSTPFKILLMVAASNDARMTIVLFAEKRRKNRMNLSFVCDVDLFDSFDSTRLDSTSK
jgi:hypothetical protein